MSQLFLNNCYATLAQPITATDTAIQIVNMNGFPSVLNEGEFFLLTIFTDTTRYGENIEIVKVTGIAGSTLTVERGIEGSAVSHASNERLESRLTAGTLRNLVPSWDQVSNKPNVAIQGEVATFKGIQLLSAYVEDFESGFGLWANAAGNKSNWERTTGSTPSSNTGPSGSTSGSYYVFIETSSSGSSVAGDVDSLEYTQADSVNISGIEFLLHQYGNAQGTLYLEGFDGLAWVELWQSTGDQGNEWHPISVTVTPGYSKFRFRNVAAGGYYGDVAIDGIKLLTPINIQDWFQNIDSQLEGINTELDALPSQLSSLSNEINEVADSLVSHDHSWDDIQNKPTTFTPSEHNHNLLYYTKTEVDTKLGDIGSILDAINGEVV